jgi:hypothetical protein
MKALIPWKKQTRFTLDKSKPDIEPLENDRIFQNGKYRHNHQEKIGKFRNNKREMENIQLQMRELWDIIQKETSIEIPIPLQIPSMSFLLNTLNDLVLDEHEYLQHMFSWPVSAELNFEDKCFTNIWTMAKLLSLYGSLIRKSKSFGLERGEISELPSIIFKKEDFYLPSLPILQAINPTVINEIYL